jgi:hypothetical protein
VHERVVVPVEQWVRSRHTITLEHGKNPRYVRPKCCCGGLRTHWFKSDNVALRAGERHIERKIDKEIQWRYKKQSQTQNGNSSD